MAFHTDSLTTGVPEEEEQWSEHQRIANKHPTRPLAIIHLSQSLCANTDPVISGDLTRNCYICRRIACSQTDEAPAAKMALLQRSIYVSKMVKVIQIWRLEMTMDWNGGPVPL